MTSKYNNFAMESGPIEIDINAISGEPILSTAKKHRKGHSKGKKGSPPRRQASQDSSEKKSINKASLNFSRLKAQNMTGFTNDSVETGAIDGKTPKMTPLAHRKTSMFPDISAVEQFYDRN
mmetsp:Transcript_9060/g.12311  ORF Transcript_9060/g.12311 Transcript_9060/m.12311 type:complete len:121 (+) Transcript_9060:1583-1945(+)